MKKNKKVKQADPQIRKSKLVQVRVNPELQIDLEIVGKGLNLPVSTTIKFLLNEILNQKKYKDLVGKKSSAKALA